MPAPTPLDVATQSVQRLVKEEKSYHKELDTQNSRVAKIESEISAGTGDENAEYVLKQEKAAAAETQAVFGPLRQRIEEAVSKLEEQIALSESEGATDAALEKAREVLGSGRAVVEKGE
ncbi:tubulin binding cofactor A [Coniochaeta ligniaria NRRL 30616]|uniref:Tubulin-specific chaperone A n=1 Tax=Coniochaeta ligniaria NRRL 30616 TaxID=1408157 RepID=A0A1J7JWV5_9PEZI|nr:tubulin binding cofactor A [Coniochaeta ligniaria NRRL 30616]